MFGNKKVVRARGSVTPDGVEGMTTVGTLAAIKKLARPWRTANENEMRLSAAICTANIAEAKDGEWVPIAPYGEHPSPDGSYVQRFDRAQSDKVVATWNSITGVAARSFKNLWHGLGAKTSCPVWDGHPETDKLRWPKAKCLAEIIDLRTGNEALEGQIRWTSNARPKGPLYPSPLWWHWPPAGTPPTVFPELLESIGLVPTPNIASVPAWTQNAKWGDGVPTSPSTDLASQSEAEKPTQTENEHMNRSELIKHLGLPADATDDQINAALKGIATANSDLQTANAAKATAEQELATAKSQLTTANSQVTTITAERDQLKTANAELTTANETLVVGALDLAEKRGAITPAERESFKTRLTTANTAGDALKELQTRKAVNTESVVINGNRLDLTTANARAEALESAIGQKMKDEGLTRDAAFAKCQADPNLSGLFGAMADPTRKTA